MKNYVAPSIEEVKVVAMEHIAAGEGGAGGDGNGQGHYGRPGM